MSNEPTFTLINQAADGDYCLAIRGGKLVVALCDAHDPYQQWMRKDSAILDAEGQRSFALVNKATNQAFRHESTIGPMDLVPYDAGSQDSFLLWTESKYDDQGFRYIRRVGCTGTHITANSHELNDGRGVDLTGGVHISERWKFVPYQQQVPNQQTITISCRRKDGYNLTIRDDTLMLAPADTKDKYQIWIKDMSYGHYVKDVETRRAFALVNKATGKAITHGFGSGYLAKMTQFNPTFVDGSVLWTESGTGEGFQEIRMQSNVSTIFHAFYAPYEADSNKALLALRLRNNSIDQQWKFQETTVWDPAWDTSITPPAPSGEGQWNPSKADIIFEDGLLTMK